MEGVACPHATKIVLCFLQQKIKIVESFPLEFFLKHESNVQPLR